VSIHGGLSTTACWECDTVVTHTVLAIFYTDGGRRISFALCQECYRQLAPRLLPAAVRGIGHVDARGA
jgi:hypothetical protein